MERQLLSGLGGPSAQGRASGYIEVVNDLLSATRAGLTAAGAVPPVHQHRLRAATPNKGAAGARDCTFVVVATTARKKA